MSLLVPDPGLLFWMLLSFGIVLWLLMRYAFPTIVKGIEGRKAYVAASLDKARQAEKRLESVETQAREILDAARRERGETLRQGEKMAAGIVEKARLDAAEQSRRILAQADEEAVELRRKAMDEASGQIASLAVMIAGKLLGEELKTTDSQKKLIERMLNERVQ